MAKHGNLFYKEVKLVEPAANLRVFQLGQQFDSRIRISDDFETFVHGSIEAMKKEDGVDVRPFLETVFHEDNIEMVFLFTGHSNTRGTHSLTMRLDSENCFRGFPSR